MFLLFPPVRKKPVSTVFSEKLLSINDCDNILSSLLNNQNSETTKNIVNNNVYNDLEIFNGNQESTDSIFSSIDKTNTHLGKYFLKERLNDPTINIDTLTKRQNIIKELLKNKELYDLLNEKFKIIKELEKSIIWTLKKKTLEENRLINSVYFQNKYLKLFNNNEQVLLYYNYFKIIFSPLYGILSPILFLILPFIYLKLCTNIRFEFSAYFRILKMSLFGSPMQLLGGGGNTLNYTKYLSLVLSFIIYIQNAINSVDIAIKTNEIIDELHKKVNDVSKFMETGYDILNETKTLFNREELKPLFPILYSETFKKEPSLLSNKGRILVTFNILNENKQIFDIMKYIGEVDSYLSITKLFKTNENLNGKFSFPKYITSSKPVIDMKDLWHPYLDANNVVVNDISLGGKSPQNTIITGPNAGGKSTSIKSICISILLGQTLGICPSESSKLTPFSLINSYLNIPDCKGKESLFEAEMHRARDHINLLNQLSSNQFGFVIMDEIFSSTNPEEGISGGYAIADKLSNYNNSISIITTHFNYLTKLESLGKYSNLKIPINRDEDNNIKYPYKIEKGVNNQFIALELLKEKGFDESIIDKANEICKNINKQTIIEDKTNESKKTSETNETNESKETSETSETKETNKNYL